MRKKTIFWCFIATLFAFSVFNPKGGFGQDNRIPINTEVLTTLGKAKLENLRDLFRDNLATQFLKESVEDKVGLGLLIALEETLQTFREYADKERKTRLSTDAAILAMTLLRAERISAGQVRKLFEKTWPTPLSDADAKEFKKGSADRRFCRGVIFD